MTSDLSGSVSPLWAEHGFLDESDPELDTRLALLSYYESQGFTALDFAGVASEDLAQIANRRSVRPGRRVDAETACAASGLDWELFQKLATVSGYPLVGDQFTETDIATFADFRLAIELFSEDEMIHFGAVMGSSLGRIADAAAAVFRIDVGSVIDAAGGAELDYAKKNFEAAEIVKRMDRSLWALFVLQLELAGERGDKSRARVDPASDAHLVEIGVGFVDLVGFTPFSVDTPVSDLALFIREFEQEAVSIVASHGGRLVKLLGDEVMFVAVDVDETIRIAVALMDAVAATGVRPHGGVTHGDVIARGGDYYGQVVNLASRIAALAVPGELLVDTATAMRSSDHVFEPSGRRQIKGFPEPVRLSSLVSSDTSPQ